MRVALVSIYPLGSKQAHSGVNSAMFAGLRATHPDAAFFSPDTLQKNNWCSLWNRVAKRLNAPRMLPIHTRSVSQKVANFIQLKLDAYSPEFILSPSPLAVAYLKTAAPIATYTDATVAGMRDYYADFTNLSEFAYQRALEVERLGFNRASRCFFASDWAASGAVEHYGILRQKISVLPRPANLNITVDEGEIAQLIRHRFVSSPKHFLFIGVDWERKGGARAWEIVRKLLETESVVLDIVGCTPPMELQGNDRVHCHGFLDKTVPAQMEKLRGLFRSAFAFILPTNAEAMGIVFNEASVFGLPLLANRTGGVDTVVKDMSNGLFLNTRPDVECIDYIKHLMLDFTAYSAVSTTAWRNYRNSLDWGSAVQRIVTETIL